MRHLANEIGIRMPQYFSSNECTQYFSSNECTNLMLSLWAGLTLRLVPAALTQPHSHRSLLEEGLEIQLCVFCLGARKYYPFNQQVHFFDKCLSGFTAISSLQLSSSTWEVRKKEASTEFFHQFYRGIFLRHCTCVGGRMDGQTDGKGSFLYGIPIIGMWFTFHSSERLLF